MTTKPFSWKIFFILLGAATLGLIAVIPYSLTLQSGAPQPTQPLPMPLPLQATIQIAAQVVMFGIAIAIGLFLANRIGLGLPILEAGLRGESVGERIKSILPISIILGIVASLTIVALELLVFQPTLKAQGLHFASATAAHPAAWEGFLASFYGGINEELLLRLFVLTFLAWLGHFLNRTADGRPTLAVLWIANVLAAILFGLGHLPVTAALLPLTPLVILRALVLNGVAGIAFGYLYFTRGLESSMLSHFIGDLVLHVFLAI